ncbi:MAG: TonB-dependent receptor, partial [Gammaproteobacteria bacterium]|nr:TonB-dependent receptor [Gammaproteobacteria bacterium]
NRYGYFSFTLPAGNHKIIVNYIGYKPYIQEINLDKNIELNIKLEQTLLSTDSIVVIAEAYKKIEEETQMSVIEVPIGQIQMIPAIAGEVDLLKAIQLLPGVQSGSEGTSGIYVRGGGPDQNLIIIDDAPVYNAMHLFGFLSVFNADAIKKVSLTKGGFPARYGGRLSSVLDIQMKDGNMKEFKGKANIGIIATRATWEG